MGLFWDKLKAMFKKNNDVEMAEDLNDEFLTAIDNHVAAGGTMTFVTKKITILPQYDPQLAYRKSKSQSRNWKRWKNRV